MHVREKKIRANTTVAEAGLFVWTVTTDSKGEAEVE